MFNRYFVEAAAMPQAATTPAQPAVRLDMGLDQTLSSPPVVAHPYMVSRDGAPAPVATHSAPSVPPRSVPNHPFSVGAAGFEEGGAYSGYGHNYDETFGPHAAPQPLLRATSSMADAVFLGSMRNRLAPWSPYQGPQLEPVPAPPPQIQIMYVEPHFQHPAHRIPSVVVLDDTQTPAATPIRLAPQSAVPPRSFAADEVAVASIANGVVPPALKESLAAGPSGSDAAAAKPQPQSLPQPQQRSASEGAPKEAPTKPWLRASNFGSSKPSGPPSTGVTREQPLGTSTSAGTVSGGAKATSGEPTRRPTLAELRAAALAERAKDSPAVAEAAEERRRIQAQAIAAARERRLAAAAQSAGGAAMSAAPPAAVVDTLNAVAAALEPNVAPVSKDEVPAVAAAAASVATTGTPAPIVVAGPSLGAKPTLPSSPPPPPMIATPIVAVVPAPPVPPLPQPPQAPPLLVASLQPPHAPAVAAPVSLVAAPPVVTLSLPYPISGAPAAPTTFAARFPLSVAEFGAPGYAWPSVIRPSVFQLGGALPPPLPLLAPILNTPASPPPLPYGSYLEGLSYVVLPSSHACEAIPPHPAAAAPRLPPVQRRPFAPLPASSMRPNRGAAVPSVGPRHSAAHHIAAHHGSVFPTMPTRPTHAMDSFTRRLDDIEARMATESRATLQRLERSVDLLAARVDRVAADRTPHLPAALSVKKVAAATPPVVSAAAAHGPSAKRDIAGTPHRSAAPSVETVTDGNRIELRLSFPASGTQ